MKSKSFGAVCVVLLTAAMLAPATFPIAGAAQTFRPSTAPDFEMQFGPSPLYAPQFASPSNVPDFGADYFTGPVSMAFDSRGRLFVGTFSGKILILLDHNEDGAVDQVKTFATGVLIPLGLEFRADGDLFVTSNLLGGVGRIVRLRDQDGDDVAEEKTIILDGLPSEGDHQTDKLKFGPDGLLYFGQGSSTDNGTPEPGRVPERPFNATIVRIDVDNPQASIFASGLRNPFGMAFHPENGQLFTTDGGSGELCSSCPEDTSPLEEVNWVVQNGHYGFPSCEGTPDPGNPACAGVRAPVTQFPQHLTPTSITFYTGPQAGEPKNQMLVTLFKRLAGTGGNLKRFALAGNATIGFQATEIVPPIANFGLIDPGDGPVDTAIDPITGDIYVARFDPVHHRDQNEHHHYIYRIHRVGSDALTFIGAPKPTAVKAGSQGVTISLFGRRVKPGAVVFDVTDGLALVTLPGTRPFEFVAELPASVLASERTITLEVRNPDGSQSNQQTFSVTTSDPDPPPQLSPQLASLFVYKKKRKKVVNPLRVEAIVKKLRLVVSGTDFDAGAQLLVNDVALQLVSSSATELVGRVTNQMVAAAGELNVQVKNSTGKVSNTLKLVVSP
ncbi:MAG: PQQ-dependent sugar dehydrogenase [Blastocatellia bacterium]